ncbi:hypothetical protein ACTMQA_27260 [Klebsiella variicola]|uniref:hypothetical protein n=1 Tax=Klebsiella variicola TaxID=244366 RepID=UPI003F8A8274
MKDESKDKLSAAKGTLTVRHLPADVDAAITAQAKAAGRSKSDFIQEFLSASFGDIIGNFWHCCKDRDSEASGVAEGHQISNTRLTRRISPRGWPK